jgi:YYY domain-containing protein
MRIGRGMQGKGTLGLLGGILLVALALRLYGLDWDGGYLFHPDERAILWCVHDLGRDPSFYASSPFHFCGSARAPWNPGWFPYGSLPLYLLKGVQKALEPWKALGLADLRIPGRVLTALADTLIVAGVFLLGRALFGLREAVVGAFLAAFAVIHIQLAHFYTADTFLALFSLGAVVALFPVAQRGSWVWAGVGGGLVGLALASKVAGAPLLLPLVLAPTLYLLGGEGEAVLFTPPDRKRWVRAGGALAISLVSVVVVNFVAQPYAYLDWPTFLAHVREQGEMVRRVRDYPYTLQYVGTTPYLYHVDQLARWGLGFPAGVMSWAGFVGAPLWAWRSRSRAQALALAWVAPYFLIVGGLPVKYLRYLLPIVPFLLVYGAHLLALLVEVGRRGGPWRLLWGVGGGVLLGTAAYGIAYASLYRTPHPALEASRWLREHAPPGALILKEHWEEGIPHLGAFRVEELPLYDPDTLEKLIHLAGRLSEAHYLVFYSHRLYGTIPRLPQRYPFTGRYYALLFSGRLGYEVVYWGGRWPSLLGVTLLDDPFRRPGLPVPTPLRDWKPSPLTLRLGFADESFTVYDHPLVLVFRRVRDLEPGTVLGMLLEEARPPPPATPLLSPREATDQRRGGTWSTLFPPGDPLGRVPLLGWLVVLYAVGGVGVLWGFWVFRALPDRGWMVGRTLGLLGVGYLAWLAAGLKAFPFGRTSAILAWALLLVGGGVLAWRGRREWGGFLRERWPLLAIEEALFASAFAAFLVLRMANPDLWHPYRGGEKPMDLAYLNAVVKSTWFPPYDPWFAGGAMNYYYFGWVLVGALVRLTAVPTPVAYNLAVPTWFALAVGSAFSIAYTLGGGGGKPGGRGLGLGIGGAAFAFGVGNLDGAVQVVGGAWASLHGRPFPPFDYWRPTRLMPPDPPGFEITEFPFFTFLFADLHPHLLAIPLVLLVLAGCLCLMHRGLPGAEGPPFPLLVALALGVGALLPTNPWDFPGMAALVVLAATLSARPLGPLGRLPPARTTVRQVLGGLGVVAGGVLLFLPFHLRFVPPTAGVEPTVARTHLAHYLAIHGLFLFPLVTWLAWEGLPPLVGRGPSRPLRIGGVALLAGGLLALALQGYGTVAFLLGLGALATGAGWEAWRRRDGRALFTLLMTGVALAIGVGVDLVRLEGDIDRMNTVFKFYLQGWLLLALSSSYALGRVGSRLGGLPLAWRAGWSSAFALLLAAALVYPVLGTRARLADRFAVLPLTLDGTAYMERAVYRDERGDVELRWDREAIRWLWAHVEGTPVIAEANTPLYRWGGRVSVYTGLPSVVGWSWHQMQQRCGRPHCPVVEERLADVHHLYASPDIPTTVDVLRRYGVEYIYVGETERLYYAPQGLEKLAVMAHQGLLGVVYQSEKVTIYRTRLSEGD